MLKSENYLFFSKNIISNYFYFFSFVPESLKYLDNNFNYYYFNSINQVIDLYLNKHDKNKTFSISLNEKYRSLLRNIQQNHKKFQEKYNFKILKSYSEQKYFTNLSLTFSYRNNTIKDGQI